MADEIDLKTIQTLLAGQDAMQRICEADPTIEIRSRAQTKLEAALKEYVEAYLLHEQQQWINAEENPNDPEILAHELEFAREHAPSEMDFDSMSGYGLWIAAEIIGMLNSFECCWTSESWAEDQRAIERMANDPLLKALKNIRAARAARGENNG